MFRRHFFLEKKGQFLKMKRALLCLLQNLGGGHVPPGPPVPLSMDCLNPDVIRGTESRLSQDIKSSEIHRKDRNRNGGGVFVTCKDHFKSWSLEDSDVNCEIIWTEIQTGTNNIIVETYYRLLSASINSLEQLN